MSDHLESCGGAPWDVTNAAKNPRSETDIVAIAREEIYRICAGRGRSTLDGKAGKDWRMSIPVRDDDSDRVFARLADECDRLRADRDEWRRLCYEYAAKCGQLTAAAESISEEFSEALGNIDPGAALAILRGL